MKLLTAELIKRFEKVGRQEEINDPLVIANFLIQLGRELGMPPNMILNQRISLVMFLFLVIGMMNGVISHLKN